MKTDQLIAALATGTPAVDPHMVRRRYALALAGGAITAMVLMLTFIGGVRADILQAATLPMFWVKFGFIAAMVVTALLMTLRLGRPGMKLGVTAWAWLLPVAVVWLIAVLVLIYAAPGEREHLLYGVSWKVCSLNVAMLSAPVFVAALWAMKGLAPTRPMLAGAASGLLAGATGALVYAFYCPEMAAPFLGIWYLGGMLMPALLGAVLGPILLRW
jgi:hypothetical protein